MAILATMLNRLSGFFGMNGKEKPQKPWESSIAGISRNGVRSYMPEDTSPFDEKMKQGPDVRFPAFLPFYDALQNVRETPQMRMAYRTMLNDAYVTAGWRTQVLSVGATEINFIPWKPFRQSKPNPRDEEICEFSRWVFKQRLEGGTHTLAWQVLAHGTLAGLSISEKLWGIQDAGEWKSKAVLRQTKAKDVDQDCVLEIDAYRNIVGVRTLRYNSNQVYPPGDFIIYRNLTLWDSPTGIALFRHAYRPYWLMDTAWKLRGFALEKRYGPIAVAHAPEDKRVATLAAMALLKTQNALVLPMGVEAQVIDLAGKADDIFHSAIADLREEILLALTGAFMQMVGGQQNVKRGSGPGAEGQANKLEWWLAQCLLEILNNEEHGLIRELVDLNFLAVSGYPRAAIGAVDAPELKEELELDKGLDEIFEKAGFRQPPQIVAERYGRQIEEAPQQPMQPEMPNGQEMPGGQDQPPENQVPMGKDQQEVPAESAQQTPPAAPPQQFAEVNPLEKWIRQLLRPGAELTPGTYRSLAVQLREHPGVASKFQRSQVFSERVLGPKTAKYRIGKKRFTTREAAHAHVKKFRERMGQRRPGPSPSISVVQTPVHHAETVDREKELYEKYRAILKGDK